LIVRPGRGRKFAGNRHRGQPKRCRRGDILRCSNRSFRDRVLPSAFLLQIERGVRFVNLRTDFFDSVNR
jgi:hypothetical protein